MTLIKFNFGDIVNEEDVLCPSCFDGYTTQVFARACLEITILPRKPTEMRLVRYSHSSLRQIIKKYSLSSLHTRNAHRTGHGFDWRI